MYDLAPRKRNMENLFVQPIIVKDYGEEFDKALAFLVSTSDMQDVYKKIAIYSIEKEIEEKINNPRQELFGQVKFTQSEYYEGFDRYRNKYKMYTDQGIIKAKEVLGEALLFFHDIVIRDYFSNFMERVNKYFPNNKREDIDVLSSLEINPFFLWWMRLSANTLRDKIDIINSNELKKDLIEINTRLQGVVDEYKSIVAETDKRAPFDNRSGNLTLQEYIKDIGLDVLRAYQITNRSGEITFKSYISQITNEITTYAEGKIFEATKEDQEVRNNILKDDILLSVLNELKNF
jgi:hypothetical protein